MPCYTPCERGVGDRERAASCARTATDFRYARLALWALAGGCGGIVLPQSKVVKDVKTGQLDAVRQQLA